MKIVVRPPTATRQEKGGLDLSEAWFRRRTGQAMPPWGLGGLPVGLTLFAPLLSPQQGSLERVGGRMFGDLGQDLL
ncbi:MAG: hypothetical protein ACR2LD_02415, partial [Actinomycetota bacterium]